MWQLGTATALQTLIPALAGDLHKVRYRSLLGPIPVNIYVEHLPRDNSRWYRVREE